MQLLHRSVALLMVKRKLKAVLVNCKYIKIKETEDSDGTVDINIAEEGRSDICKTDNDVSKDEFDSDLVTDEGESNGEKRVTFQLDSDQMEIAKSSTGTILDSSQETESVTSRDPIWIQVKILYKVMLHRLQQKTL